MRRSRTLLATFVAGVVIIVGITAVGVEIPTEWREARILSGLYGDGCESRSYGTAQLKCGKANKNGIAKVSLTITPFWGGRSSYRTVSVDVSHGGKIEVRWILDETAYTKGYYVVIDGDEFFGEPIYGDSRPCCTPSAVWNAKLGGSLMKKAVFYFGGNEWDWEGCWGWPWPDNIESAVEVKCGKNEYCAEVCTYKPVVVTMDGNRWICPKAAGVKWDSTVADWVVDERNVKMDLTDNMSGLKLSYNAKTGLFKGGFYLYERNQKDWIDDNGKRRTGRATGKKHSVKVVGVVVNGEGYGWATCTKLSPEPWPVLVR